MVWRNAGGICERKILFRMKKIRSRDDRSVACCFFASIVRRSSAVRVSSDYDEEEDSSKFG